MSLLYKYDTQVYNHTVMKYNHVNINQMWILKNSKDLMDHFNYRTFSNISSVQIFDFSNLYTTIHHENLKPRLTEIIHKAFYFKNDRQTQVCSFVTN